VYTFIYMYLGIDVGASKTLFAVFEPGGQLVYEHKIATPQDYEQFKSEISKALRTDLAKYKFTACCAALPGWLDLDKGLFVAGGRIPWRNISIIKDMAGLMPDMKVFIHNDAKLAGLSEALLIQKEYRKVLYLTISTGIGGGIIIDGVIDPDFANFEPGQMMLEYNGQPQKWEAFASGRALKARYGKLASEIQDEKTWKEYSGLLTLGLEELLATIQPQAVVFGGGVGAHFEKFKPFLEQNLKAINNPMVPIPPLIKARRAEEAVIYGCYDYIVQNT
jgi:predicted NBD/HSP70 family sugar kinase